MEQKKELAAEHLYNLVGDMLRQGIISRYHANKCYEDILVLMSDEEERQRRLVFSNQQIEVYERAKNVAK